jgi:predicted TIM-barrel fold metal-dependent hydrolase
MIVDVHHHWTPQRLLDEFEPHVDPRFEVGRADNGIGLTQHGIYVGPNLRDKTDPLERHVAAMDAAGIDVAVLHLSLWAEWITLEAARWINEDMARQVARFPGRFVGLAHVPLLDPGAPAELERAVKELGLKGLAATSHVGDVPLDGAEARPVFRKAAELGVPVVVHGAALPLEWSTQRSFNLARSMGRAMDLLSASGRLVCTDLLDELPNLRLVLAHIGGGFHAQRYRIVDFNPDQRERLERHLAQMLFDTAPPHWSAQDMAYAVAALGAGTVVLGSDYPIILDAMPRALELVRQVDMPASARADVEGGTVARLFGLG